MKYLMLMALLLSAACASARPTVHQYCQAHPGEYKNYEQCYTEVFEIRKAEAAAPVYQRAPTSCYTNGGFTNCY